MSRDNTSWDAEGMAKLQRDLKRNRVKYVRSSRGIRVSRGIQGTKVRIVASRGGGSSSSSGKSRWAMTSTSSAGVVTIGAGSILLGAWREADPVNVTVSGGSVAIPHYIYATVTLSSGAVAIASTAVASKPTSDAASLRIVLHTVYRNGNTVVQLFQNQASDIILDRVYA